MDFFTSVLHIGASVPKCDACKFIMEILPGKFDTSVEHFYCSKDTVSKRSWFVFSHSFDHSSLRLFIYRRNQIKKEQQ